MEKKKKLALAAKFSNPLCTAYAVHSAVCRGMSAAANFSVRVQRTQPPPESEWNLNVSCHPAAHLPPGFDALVDIVRERAAGDEAAGPLRHVQVAIFQHDLALADDDQRSPTQLHPFKDVILRRLETGWEQSHQSGARRLLCLLRKAWTSQRRAVSTDERQLCDWHYSWRS